MRAANGRERPTACLTIASHDFGIIPNSPGVSRPQSSGLVARICCLAQSIPLYDGVVHPNCRLAVRTRPLSCTPSCAVSWLRSDLPAAWPLECRDLRPPYACPSASQAAATCLHLTARRVAHAHPVSCGGNIWALRGPGATQKRPAWIRSSAADVRARPLLAQSAVAAGPRRAAGVGASGGHPRRAAVRAGGSPGRACLAARRQRRRGTKQVRSSSSRLSASYPLMKQRLR